MLSLQLKEFFGFRSMAFVASEPANRPLYGLFDKGFQPDLVVPDDNPVPCIAQFGPLIAVVPDVWQRKHTHVTGIVGFQ